MVSIRTIRRHCLAKARVCLTAAVWGDHYGGNYGQAPEGIRARQARDSAKLYALSIGARRS